MPTPRPSWLQPGLRFCGSCLVTLAYWSVWLVLGATLAMLVYVATAKELPVPAFVLRRVEARLAEANLTVRFGRARCDPTGKILLENVELRSRQFEEPLLTSRLVFVRRSLWNILAGRAVPDEIQLEGATLQLPAMLSPSGTIEPVVRDLAAVVRHDENLWHVDQFSGRLGVLPFTAQGDIGAPAGSAGPAAPAPEEIVARFLQIGRQLVLDVHQFDAFEEPALSLRLGYQNGRGNTAALLFTARGARRPWSQPVVLGPLAVAASFRTEGRGGRNIRFHTAVRHASLEDLGEVENVRAVISARLTPENFSFRPIEALVAFGSVAADNERALGPVVRANLSGWPAVRGNVAIEIDGEAVATEVEAQLKDQTARLRAEGRGPPDFIGRVLARHTPRAAPYFIFGDPVTFTAEATLAPGWRFDRLSARVAAGRLDSHGVKITAARGRIDIVGTSFLAHDARVELGASYGRGSYWMNFATTDYRMLLDGRIRPAEINGWFTGSWWLDFWDDHFQFPGERPRGDVDVQGRWRDPARTEYFGRAEAAPARVLGADFDRADSLIFLRPNFTDALDLSASRAGGRQSVQGRFKRFTEPASRETNRLEFDLESDLGPETYARMFPGKVDALLGSFSFAQAPRVRVHGDLEGKWPGAIPHYAFTGQTEGGLRYFGFPLESASVAGHVAGDDVRLDEIQFEIAGGKGAGNASLFGPPAARQLGFDLYLNGADLARTIRAFEDYQASRTGAKSESVSDSKFIKRASGGRLDVAMSAQGQPGDLPSFKGTGNAALTGAELGEIHLFGLLSQALSGLSLNFSSLKLDAAHTSFRLDGGRLWFPDLKVTGPSAVIDARGNYAFATNALDFTAKFKPFEESRSLLTAAIGIVINPITSILELQLSGPLNKPDWSFVVGQSSPRAGLAPAAATAPVLPAPPSK